jgi:hypothetical protein
VHFAPGKVGVGFSGIMFEITGESNFEEGFYMKKAFSIGILALLLVFGISFTGCQTEVLSSDATLKSITIAGVTASLGEPNTDWRNSVAGHVYLTISQLADASVEVEKSEGGSIVYFAKAAKEVEPNFVYETSFSFENDDRLYVEVFSPNLDAYLIYQVIIYRRTNVALDGRDARTLAPPAATYDQAGEGELWFGASKAGTPLSVSVIPEEGVTTYQIARVQSATGTPNYDSTDGPASYSINNGDYIYVKTTAASGVLVYKFICVVKGDSTDLTGITINGVPVTLGPKGTDSFIGIEAYGNYTLGAELAPGEPLDPSDPYGGTRESPSVYRPATRWTNIEVNATPADSNATVTYDHTYNHKGEILEFENTTGSLGNLPTGEYVGIEVTSEIGDKGWYKVRVAYGSTDTALSDIKVGGVSVTPPQPADPSAPPTEAPVGGGIFFIIGENMFFGESNTVTVSRGTKTVEVTKATAAANATIRYGSSYTGLGTIAPAPGFTIPPGQTNNTNITDVFPDGFTEDITFFVEVLSEDRTSVLYYRVEVTVAE